MTRITGNYLRTSVADESFDAFVPFPLPPDPPIELNPADQELLEEANRNIGRLDGAIPFIDIPLYTYMYVRKEAVLSSQIEGTQSSLSDLLLHESEQVTGVPLEDVLEVSSYVSALDHGLNRIRSGFPISNRLVNEIHKILLSHGRGSSKSPGEFRKSQNWIGGSRLGNAVFVPPPPQHVGECMGELEKYIHDIPQRTPPLTKAALAHVQFETIHPFLDGNGRIGRLLITLLLCSEGVLTEPILYLSLFFKQNRDEYYERLKKVRTDGDWEGWLRFFLQGVNETSKQAVRTADSISTLFENDRTHITGLKRTAGSTLQIHTVFQRNPILSITQASELSSLAFQTSLSAIERLCEMGIAEEITGHQRKRLYIYREYLDLLNQGTEPIG